MQILITIIIVSLVVIFAVLTENTRGSNDATNNH